MASRIELELLELTDDGFEQLVFALVAAEHPDVDWRRVRLVRAADGGVDVMLVGELAGRQARPRWSNSAMAMNSSFGSHPW